MNRQRIGCRCRSIGKLEHRRNWSREDGLLIITHHDKLLEHNPPDFTHVMLGGRIVETGGPELARELHDHGYDRIRKTYPDADAANQQMTAKEESALATS